MNLINITQLRNAFDTVILALPKNTTFTSNEEIRVFCYDIFSNEIDKQIKYLELDSDTSSEELFSNYDFAEEVYYDYQAVLSMHPYKSIN